MLTGPVWSRYLSVVLYLGVKFQNHSERFAQGLQGELGVESSHKPESDTLTSEFMSRWIHYGLDCLLMIMIAFITMKSSLVPLIEVLCAQI